MSKVGFPLIPNHTYQEDWDFLTDVLITISGIQSRMSVRELPRMSFRASFGPVTREERIFIAETFRERMKTIFVCPNWAHASRIDQNSASGAFRVYFEKRSLPLTEGVPVVFLNPITNAIFVRVVSAIETDGVTLTIAIPENINGSYLVMTGAESMLEDSGFVWNTVTGMVSLTIKFVEDYPILGADNSEVVNNFRGSPVLERRFLAPSEEMFTFSFDTIDFETGRREFSTRKSLVKTLGRKRFICKRFFNPADMNYFLKFFDLVKGSWKSFWLSTQLPDMIAVATAPYVPVPRDDVLIVQPITLDVNDAYRNIVINYADGTNSYHRITTQTTFTSVLTVRTGFSGTDLIDLFDIEGITQEDIDAGEISVTSAYRATYTQSALTIADITNQQSSLDIEFYATLAGSEISPVASTQDNANDFGSVIINISVTRTVPVGARYVRIFALSLTAAPLFQTRTITLNTTQVIKVDPTIADAEADGFTGLILSPALPNDNKVQTIQSISYLLRVRMSDNIVFEHGSHETLISFLIESTNEGDL